MIRDLILIIIVISMCVFVILGMFNIIKSYIKHEPYNKYRIFYLAGFTFFFFLLGILFIGVAVDLKNFS
jgi:succinate dehydrogenase hydrophobic anchor subunit